MNNFCTLFDKNYLSQAVVLYRSLERHAGDFTLYALCMDRVAFDFLQRAGLSRLVAISVSDLENEEVLKVKERTTHGQFCWVCQPLICLHVLDNFNVDMITYLETDSMFFHDPAPLFAELSGYSVSLVPHRYAPKYDQSAYSGTYCVQFNAFRKNEESRAVLQYWRTCCFRYSKEKPVYFPGQTTLDEWPERFKGVRVIGHLGAGVAPWNAMQYRVEKNVSDILVDGIPVIFFHYHQYARYQDGSHELGEYPLAPAVIEHIYRPYARSLAEVEEWIQSIDPTFIHRREKTKPRTLWQIIRAALPPELEEYLITVKRRLKGTYNVLPENFHR